MSSWFSFRLPFRFPSTTIVRSSSSDTEPAIKIDGHDPQNLLVLVHGINGSTADWTYAEAELRKQLGTDYLIYVSSSNTYKRTFDGIDEAGKRLADEVVRLVNQSSGLKNISFLAHSLGGLFARYAIASLYSSSMIAGLVPIHFITLATPHLGVRGNKQLPLLFGLRILENLAPSVAPYLVGRTGYQLFLTDGKLNEPPLLLRMSSDCDDLKFISSLASFQTRTLYANMSYDHMVGWRTSSIRRKNEIVKSRSSLVESSEGYRNIVNIDYFPPLTSREGDDSVTRDTGRQTTMENYELIEDEMISRLQSVGWKKIDVNFCSSRLPYFAHHNIHVKRKWLNNAGTDIIAHVADCLK
ncbi:putative Lipase/serine esterase [Zostera marina]|uniref:Putative Lipase/serine esterase n=1 Tax=Zostera marina TaxID=29655 RepID=A0A0K9Q1N7_ZOSMR|nr:putative Lipase/serine esterase [Zostera marina]